MIGEPLARLEDERFLTGRGEFLDDMSFPGMLQMQFVRSIHAHARLAGVSTAAARRMNGVRLVATAADLLADSIGRIPLDFPPPGPAGRNPEWKAPLQGALARDVVRYVGEPVAAVVADTVPRARDGAEALEVDYDPLPAVGTTAAAIGAPFRVWDAFPDNVAFRHETGNAQATDAALRSAAHVVRLSLVNSRVLAAPIETRGVIAVPEPALGRVTLYVGTQRPHGIQQMLVEQVFHLRADELRVVTRDVGGGFGSKNSLYPEYILCLWAARKLGRPVKWVATRSEGMLADQHARDNVVEAELGMHADGRFAALRVRRIVNLGAYASPRTFVPTWNGIELLAGLYRIPHAHAAVEGVHTHMSPTTVYRGAGRPEAVYVCERLIDRAARTIDVDPVELRRRNCAAAVDGAIPNALGARFRDVDPLAPLDQALHRIEHASFESRRKAANAAGKLRGLGVSWFVENLHAPARSRPAWIKASRDHGLFDVVVGTMSNGQGHETAFLQIVAGRLGIPISSLRLVQGDTEAIPVGTGTGASWSVTLAGSSLSLAAAEAIRLGLALAADLLETAPEDIAYSDGVFSIVGTERGVAWAEVLKACPDFAAEGHFERYEEGFPAACHAAEVEVDPETGVVHLVRYVVAQDAGKLINPLIAQGQLHGGAAQGIGQALIEGIRYDPDSGQLLSGSLMDYALPRADDLPALECEFVAGAAGDNPIGVKGIGEAGTTGAVPAVVNAVLDALAPLGIVHLDMPLGAEKVWRSIRQQTANPRFQALRG